MNIRIKFRKYGVMKFIGHLDMMRYFQKAIRRANIDIAYSEGYSPHQIMSFAAPLGVGVTSDGEYFDIEVNSSMSSKDSIEALNRVMVDGISILEYKKLPDTAKPSMALVAAADYFIYGNMEFKDKVTPFYKEQQKILITKQTKKNELELDLKPLIYEMKYLNWKDRTIPDELLNMNPDVLSNGCTDGLFLRLCTGSSNNIKPELVLEALCNFYGISYHPLDFQIHRLEVYAKSDEIPVKGEQERKAYQKYLDNLKKSYQREGKQFPEFFTLGELGENII